MPNAVALVWDLAAKDSASPAFLRVASAADKAAGATARATAGMAGSAARMSAVGARLTKGLTVPLLGIAAVSVSQAAKWQKSMTLIQTAGGETAAKTKALSSGLQKIARDTGTSLDELGEGIYTVAKAGAQKWSAVDQLKVMKAAAQGAKAENVSLGVATDALSTVMLDYHTKASGAVQVENQLIRASGLAKTNFDEFSSSLSNVVPIAAASGISFKEIGGAIATMTQHGVSAKQATENLRNLIFNLTGQNNVASAAMQQLGINTVDLAKNLGRRGLTGTLGIVDQALKAHTKNGMVTIDVHKAAALATQSLSTMTGSFTGKLKDQSRELISGKVGIKDYTNYAKSLGGTAGASALQFLGLYKNSEGFSNQLKAGKGTITTTTSQYQKMLGGMTGASVAMQIAGKYAKDNARNVREVGKAALEAGSDVLGWNKTQDTLAVKMDKAKASLQVLAVEIGTALIPAVSKIADWVGRAAHSFDGLSGSQKKMLLWSAGILAAVGPVLAIGGRLGLVASGMGRAAGGIGTAFARIGGASAITATRVSAGMKGITGALIGAGVGYGIGKLTENASGATKAFGTLASTVSGAALGFAAGGPIGAALGAGAGLLGNLVAGFGHSSSAAKNAVSGIDAFTDAIKRDNLALGVNTKSIVANDFNKRGKDGKSTFDSSIKLGIDPKALTDAATGNKTARAQVAKILSGYSDKSLGLTAQGVPTAGVLSSRGAGLVGVKADQTHLTEKQEIALKSLQAAAHRTAEALGLENDAVKQGKKDADRYAKATSTAGKNDTARAKALKVFAAAQKKYSSGLSALNTQAAVHGTGLTGKSADATSNVAGIRKMVGAANTLAKSYSLTSGSVTDVNAKLKANDNALRASAVAAGFSGTAVDKLIAKYRLTPKQIVTNLVANIGKATASAGQLQKTIDDIRQGKVPGLTADSAQGRAVIKALQDRINQLQGNHVRITVTIDAKLTAAAQKYQKFLRDSSANLSIPTNSKIFTQAVGTQARFGQSTIPPNTRFTVGEKGWEGGVTDSQGRATIFSHTQSKAMGYEAPTGYASGSSSSNYAAIAALLKSMGATRAGIAGFLGNTKIESGGRTTAVGGPAHGLQQWQDGRFAQLQHLASAMGATWRSQAAQLAMIKRELTHGYGGTLKVLRGAKSASSAAAYVDQHYEISSGAARGARMSAAAGFYRSGVSKGGGVYTVNGKQYTTATGAHNAQVAATTAIKKAADKFLTAAATTKTTAAQMSTAVKALAAAAHQSRIPGATRLLQLAGQRDTANSRLGAPAAKDNPTAYQRLETAKSSYNDANSTYRAATGQVDYTSLGVPTQVYSDQAAAKPSAAGFITGLQALVAKSRSFAAVLKKLVREGMPRGIVQQLAAAGPDALVQAQGLAAATPKQLLSIKSLYSQQGTNAAASGKTVADAYYKAGVNSAQGLVNGLLSQRARLNRAIISLSSGMVKTLKHHLGIHSPSTVFRYHGRMIGEGTALGIEDKYGRIEQAASKMVAVPRPVVAAQPVTPVAAAPVHVTQHITVHDDPVAFANASARRIAMLLGG